MKLFSSPIIYEIVPNTLKLCTVNRFLKSMTWASLERCNCYGGLNASLLFLLLHHFPVKFWLSYQKELISVFLNNMVFLSINGTVHLVWKVAFCYSSCFCHLNLNIYCDIFSPSLLHWFSYISTCAHCILLQDIFHCLKGPSIKFDLLWSEYTADSEERQDWDPKQVGLLFQDKQRWQATGILQEFQ